MAASETLSIIIEAVDQASDVAAGISDRFQAMGKKMALAGAGLGLAVAPAVGLLGDATRQAIDYQSAMTNAQAVLGATADEMVGLSDQILDAGMNARAGPQAVSEAYYDIVSGVADASTHMAILDSAIKTSEAGAASLGGTTAALVSIMNSYGYAADDAATVSDVLTATVGMGVLSMDELASAMPAVTGLASSLDVEFSELGGAMAYLTTQGFSASKASTQLQASMVSLLNPNETMKNALAELGVASGDLLVQEYGLVEALNLVAGTQVVAQEGLAKTLGSTEALGAALALTGEDASEFLDLFEESMEGATDAAHQVQMGSVAAQMDLLRANVDVLRIRIGMALLPVVNQLLGHVRPVVAAVTEWIRANPELVGTIAQVVAGVAALAAGLVVAGGVITATGTAIGLIASPIGLVVAALAALGVAYATNFLGFGDAADTVLDKVRGFAATIQDVDFGTLLDTVSERLRTTFEGVVPDLSGLRASITDALARFGIDATEVDLGGLRDDVAARISELDFSAMVLTLTGLPDAVATAARDAVDQTDLTRLPERLTKHLSDLRWDDTPLKLEKVKTTIQDALNALSFGGTDFQVLGISINGALLSALLATAGLFFGPTVGTALGISRLVAAAYESDFAGFRTALENTGIITSIEDGLNYIADAANSLWGDEEGSGSSLDISPVVSTLTMVTDQLSPVADWVEETTQPLVDGLKSLGSGLVGFIQGFQDVEVGGFLVAGVAIAAAVGLIIQAVTQVAGETMVAAGDMLPELGQAIADFTTSISRLLEGNFVGAAIAFKDGAVNIGEGIDALVSSDASTGGKLITLVASLFALRGAIGLVSPVVAKLAGGINLISGAISAVISAVAGWIGVSFGWAAVIVAAIALAVLYATNILGARDAINKLSESLTGFTIPEIWYEFRDLVAEIVEHLKYILGVGAAPDFKSQPSTAEIQANIATQQQPGGIQGKLQGLPVIGGLFRDSGGAGLAGMPYLIGRGAQPELFIPRTAGTFVPAGQYAAVGLGRGGAPVVVQFEYKPVLSLADAREAEYVIRPTIERILRANGLI